MAITISTYNHTRRRFADGSNAVGDTYKLKLLTAATFNATHTTLAATGGTELANQYGYTTGGPTLQNVTVTTVNTSECKFDADDVVIAVSGGSIAPTHGIIYNSTDTDSPPAWFINFDGAQTTASGNNLSIQWNANGIATWS